MAAEMASTATLVIRGGTIVDGTGAPPFVGDVAVRGRTISAVGRDLPVRGDREVDARGLLVTPGWVDPHTHYDAQMLWDPWFSPSCANGVTTLIVGNCGVGIAPCQPEMREFLIDICDAVENIPAVALRETVKWDWETYPEYLEVLDRHPFAADVAMLIGHSAVRTWVMGKRANYPDRPGGAEKCPVTKEEMELMSKVVEEGVAAGALGVSISRVGLHRDTKGVLTPGSLAHPDELLALARGVLNGGGGVFEMASDWHLYDDVAAKDPKMLQNYQKGEWKWITEVATMAPDKLLFTYGIGTGMTPESSRGHRGTLKALEAIKKRGGSIMGTPMMRCGFLTFNLANGVHPFYLSSTFRKLSKKAAGDVEGLAASMREPEAREKVVAETLQQVAKKPPPRGIGLYHVVFDSPAFVFPWTAEQEPSLEDSLMKRAEREGTTMLHLAYDILSHPHESHGGVLWKALYNYGSHDLDPLIEMLEHDQVVPGFADGGAHMRTQCEATTPTTMLTHFSRDRSRGAKVPLELVVAKQTSRTAQMLGLHDRGELREGMKADINIIDYEKLRVLPPVFRTDLPTGAGRMMQDVEGYRMTVCSGVVVLENDKPTGSLPGKLVRNPLSVGLKGGLKGSVPASMSLDAEELDLSKHALELSAVQGAGMSGVNRTISAEKAPASRL